MNAITQQPNKTFKIMLAVICLALVGVAGYWYWQHAQLFPETDNSYIQANVVYVAPQISGLIDHVYAQDYQHVEAKQKLFSIDPSSLELSVKQAQASLDNTINQVKADHMGVATAQALVAQRQAELFQAQQNANRILTLVNKNLVARSEGDRVTSQLKVAESALTAAKSQLAQAEQNLGGSGNDNIRIRQALATLEQAKLNLSHALIASPTAGYVVNNKLRIGSEVTAFNAAFALIEDGQWWAMANFKETDLTHIRPGQKASIHIDMYPNHPFTGVVHSISSGSGASFALLPPENATGNWVKVTQRFPVRIDILDSDAKYPLRMGASCTVVVDTQSSIPVVNQKELLPSEHE